MGRRGGRVADRQTVGDRGKERERERERDRQTETETGT